MWLPPIIFIFTLPSSCGVTLTSNTPIRHLQSAQARRFTSGFTHTDHAYRAEMGIVVQQNLM